MWPSCRSADPEPLSCLSSSHFRRPFLPPTPIHLAFPSSCLHRVKGTGGRSLSTCCGRAVFCEAPGLNTSAHCVRSPQSLVFPPSFLKAHRCVAAHCGRRRATVQPNGGAERGKKARPPRIVAFSGNMQKATLALLADIMAEC